MVLDNLGFLSKNEFNICRSYGTEKMKAAESGGLKQWMLFLGMPSVIIGEVGMIKKKRVTEKMGCAMEGEGRKCRKTRPA